MELCKGRHVTPADMAVFENTLDPTDVDGLYSAAWDAIPEDCEALDIYVTGLTVAMLAVVKVCEQRQIDLTAWHYDRNADQYYPQEILRHWACGFCGTRNSYSAGGVCSNCGAT